MKHPVFTVRKDKIRRKPKRAHKITRLYKVKLGRRSISFVSLFRAIEFMNQFTQDANLYVITLFAYQPIAERRLI